MSIEVTFKRSEKLLNHRGKETVRCVVTGPPHHQEETKKKLLRSTKSKEKDSYGLRNRSLETTLLKTLKIINVLLNFITSKLGKRSYYKRREMESVETRIPVWIYSNNSYRC